jgi:hypothetical protein
MVIRYDQVDIHPAFHSRVKEFRKNQKALCMVRQYFTHMFVLFVPSEFVSS